MHELESRNRKRGLYFLLFILRSLQKNPLPGTWCKPLFEPLNLISNP